MCGKKCTELIETGKWKLLFVIGCEFKSPVSTATEFLHLCQEGKKIQSVLLFVEANWRTGALFAKRLLSPTCVG